jgi:hypothetical protein
MLEYGKSRLVPLESARSAKGESGPSLWVEFEINLPKAPLPWFASLFYLMKISDKIL